MKMNHLVRNFLRNKGGNTLVEFALIMPLMVLLVSGIFEICMFALINNKLVRIAGTISNVICMQNITQAKLLAIMNTADEMAKPITFVGRGDVIVSQIYNLGKTTDPSKMRISWQFKNGASASKIGITGGIPANLPNNIEVLNDESIIVTEVYYNYTPYVFQNVVPAQNLYKTAVYVPRLGDMTTLLQ